MIAPAPPPGPTWLQKRRHGAPKRTGTTVVPPSSPVVVCIVFSVTPVTVADVSALTSPSFRVMIGSVSSNIVVANVSVTVTGGGVGSLPFSVDDGVVVKLDAELPWSLSVEVGVAELV
jgi:hypothetical protein